MSSGMCCIVADTSLTWPTRTNAIEMYNNYILEQIITNHFICKISEYQISSTEILIVTYVLKFPTIFYQDGHSFALRVKECEETFPPIKLPYGCHVILDPMRVCRNYISS